MVTAMEEQTGELMEIGRAWTGEDDGVPRNEACIRTAANSTWRRARSANRAAGIPKAEREGGRCAQHDPWHSQGYLTSEPVSQGSASREVPFLLSGLEAAAYHNADADRVVQGIRGAEDAGVQGGAFTGDEEAGLTLRHGGTAEGTLQYPSGRPPSPALSPLPRLHV